MSSPGIDELDRRLIAELQSDARESYAALGKQLGVSGMTAATRLNRLRTSGTLSCNARPNLPALGLTTEVFGYIQTELTALPTILDILERSPYALRVDRVTGEFDLSFHAVFPSDTALGELARALHGVSGLRRLVVHHVLGTVKQSDGWEAVFANDATSDEAVYELATGTQIPKHLEAKVTLAASWVDALARADHARLQQLSMPDVVFSIMPPHPSAGIWEGIAAVERQSDRTKQAYRRLWYRIIAVSDAQDPYAIVIDALSPVETHRGRMGTAFSRMAFAFADGRVERAASLGQMDMPDVSIGGPLYPRLPA